jgi:hypothetical protein
MISVNDQNDLTMVDEAVANMNDLGLNCTHWIESAALSVVKVVSFSPLIVRHTCTRPSVEPRIYTDSIRSHRNDPLIYTYHREYNLNQDWTRLPMVNPAYFDGPIKQGWPCRQISCHCSSNPTVNVCSKTPLNASIKRIKDVLVDTKIIFPFGLNFKCVQWNSPSHSYLSISKGPSKSSNICFSLDMQITDVLSHDYECHTIR